MNKNMSNLINQGNNLVNRKQLDSSQLISIKCEQCNSEVFEPLFYIKKIPAFSAPSGKDTYAPIQTWRCAGCGEINEEFKIKNLVQ